MSEPMTDPVEEYLDQLADAARLRGRRLRHALAEVESHLLESRAAHARDSVAEPEAGRRAVAAFGPAAEVAAGLDRAAAPDARALVRDGVRAAVLLGAVGLLAVGVSGLLAAAGGAAFGKAFVSGDGPDVTYTAARCADFQEYHPARTCAQSAMLHHYDEVVGYRLYAGVLGLLVLAGWLAVVRPWRRRSVEPRRSLPATLAPAVGAALFGAATALLLPYGALDLAVSGHSAGAGNPLSAGVVAGLAFLGFAAVLWRRLRARPA